jgi:hypothetical protein
LNTLYIKKYKKQYLATIFCLKKIFNFYEKGIC